MAASESLNIIIWQQTSAPNHFSRDSCHKLLWKWCVFCNVQLQSF